MRKIYCLDCGKLLSKSAYYYGYKRCQSCSRKGMKHSETTKRKIGRKGKDSPNLRHGKYCEDYQNYCKCGKKIYRDSKRCGSCANKVKIYIRKPKKKYYCIGCNKGIDRRSKRCHKCAMKGKRHFNYKDGLSLQKYPTEFNKILKEIIRKRDNYTCQNCGMTEKEHLIVIRFKLVIHHIDYNKKNNRKSNLITLCQWCNIRANYNREYWREYFYAMPTM